MKEFPQKGLSRTSLDRLIQKLMFMVKLEKFPILASVPTVCLTTIFVYRKSCYSN